MFFLPLLLLSLLLWVLWGNRTLLIHEIPLSLPGLPPAFDGMRIAQVSDLHNASFGKENRRLLQALSQAKPHLIVLTGDLVDSRRTNPPHGPPNLPPLTSSRATTRPGCLNILPSNPG